MKRVYFFLLFLGDLINKVVTVGVRPVTATVEWIGRQKPVVLYGGALLLGFVLLTGSITLLTWMADSQRITQTPQEGGSRGSVPQEGISRGQQDEPPSEIAESSGTPETRNQKVATRKKESMNPALVLFVAIVVSIVVGLATLVVALSAMRNGQRVRDTLEEKLFKMQHDLQRAHWAELDAKKEVQKLQEQLEEQRPDKLFGKLEHATGELEQLQLRLSESERLVGQQKQELSQLSKRQKGERQRLEQEQQHLMEEVERWHGRYVECQQKVEYLEQEYSEAQQKVEHLTQLRERLRAEIDDIGTTSTDTVRVSEN